MRTIEEIKETICADFMRNESVAELFGFTPGDSFTSHFSKVSVIGILFYIFAVAAWTLEKLFDTYKDEVDTRIEEIIPHRPRWYRDKVLAFMKGKTLIADTDRYDTEGMTEDAIAAARVVKHAVAVENRDASLLTIKVAGEKDGKRCRLDAETEAQLAAYIAEIKDAGVRTVLVNTDPDRFNWRRTCTTTRCSWPKRSRAPAARLSATTSRTCPSMANIPTWRSSMRSRRSTACGSWSSAGRRPSRQARRCWLRSTRGASRPRAISRWATSYSI